VGFSVLPLDDGQRFVEKADTVGEFLGVPLDVLFSHHFLEFSVYPAGGAVLASPAVSGVNLEVLEAAGEDPDGFDVIEVLEVVAGEEVDGLVEEVLGGLLLVVLGLLGRRLATEHRQGSQ